MRPLLWLKPLSVTSPLFFYAFHSQSHKLMKATSKYSLDEVIDDSEPERVELRVRSRSQLPSPKRTSSKELEMNSVAESGRCVKAPYTEIHSVIEISGQYRAQIPLPLLTLASDSESSFSHQGNSTGIPLARSRSSSPLLVGSGMSSRLARAPCLTWTSSSPDMWIVCAVWNDECEISQYSSFFLHQCCSLEKTVTLSLGSTATTDRLAK